MKQVIQAIPNYSEGRDKNKIEQISRAFKNKEGIKLLSVEADEDYNRTVITVLAEPTPLESAIVESVGIARDLIDMRQHKGVHLRMGAVDVIPFVPIRNITMDECIQLSERVGKSIYDNFSIPVFLYEKSAKADNRVLLPNIRAGQFEGMSEKIKLKEWLPDYGKAQIHETAGVVAVGARSPLIAYNIDLDTTDINIAKNIARVVRASGGGYEYIQATYANTKNKGNVQVTINIKDYKKNPMYRIFEAVKMEAKRYGVNVIGSEVIGALPLDAVSESLEYYLGLYNFSSDKIIENNLLE